jgi:hypothetical protein
LLCDALSLVAFFAVLPAALVALAVTEAEQALVALVRPEHCLASLPAVPVGREGEQGKHRGRVGLAGLFPGWLWGGPHYYSSAVQIKVTVVHAATGDRQAMWTQAAGEMVQQRQTV